jgi:hypothetical protein
MTPTTSSRCPPEPSIPRGKQASRTYWIPAAPYQRLDVVRARFSLVIQREGSKLPEIFDLVMSKMRRKISRNFVPSSCIRHDNSTRILSTNQIYEIDQYGPITFVLKKLPRKFSLVKIATKNFQQNVSTRIFYFLFY